MLDGLPKSAQPAARKALAENREHAEIAVDAFANLFGAKHPNAVANVLEDREQLLAFYDSPAEHLCT